MKKLEPESLFVWGRQDTLVPFEFMRHVERRSAGVAPRRARVRPRAPAREAGAHARRDARLPPPLEVPPARLRRSARRAHVEHEPRDLGGVVDLRQVARAGDLGPVGLRDHPPESAG